MPTANIRGANIHYEIVGDRGPWVALTPGGRGPGANLKYLAERIARGGYRVMLHDRRNTGASDVLLGGDEAEYAIWADDLHELLKQNDALPAFIGGSSAGCRLSLLFYQRHPEAVRSLLLWRVTGGEFACDRLAQNYYGQFVDAAKQGGMKAVAETQHFAERIAANPANRDKILNTDPQQFISDFNRWAQGFLDSISLPVIGMTEQQLKSISVPVCIIPGSDKTHPRHVGELASRLIPGAELHVLVTDKPELDLAPPSEFEEIADAHAKVYLEFMNKHAAVGISMPA